MRDPARMMTQRRVAMLANDKNHSQGMELEPQNRKKRLWELRILATLGFQTGANGA